MQVFEDVSAPLLGVSYKIVEIKFGCESHL